MRKRGVFDEDEDLDKLLLHSDEPDDSELSLFPDDEEDEEQ
jgi:hypothetical protein